MPAKAALQIEHQLPAWKLSLALPPPRHFPMLPLSVKSDCKELFQLKKWTWWSSRARTGHLLSAVGHPGV